MDGARRRKVLLAVLVFALTAAIHGLLLYALPRSLLAKYPDAAERLSKGELSGERLLDYSPLYLQVHVLARKVTSHPDAAVTLLHLTGSSLSAAVLFLVLARFFRTWIAAAGVAAFVLDRGMVAHLQAFEPEILLLLLLVLFAWSITTERVGGYLAAGVFLGLAVWTRPTFLPLLALVPVCLYLGSPRRRLVPSILAFSAPVLLLLVALWARNARALGYFSPFVMNPGTVLYEGNNPSSWGSSSIYPPLVDEVAKMHPQEADYQHAAYRLLARKATGRELSLPEVNRYWSGMAFHFLRDHPVHALKLYATKVFHSFHEYAWHDVANAFWNERWLSSHRVPTVPFSIVSALTIAGLAAGIARFRAFSIFYAALAVQLALMTVTYVSARQRVSTLWIFVFFACAAVELMTVRRRRAIVVLTCVLFVALFLHRQTDLMKEETRLWLAIRGSNALLEDSYRLRSEGKLVEAASASAASLASAPFYVDTRRPANLSFEPTGYAGSAATLLPPSDGSSWFDRAVLLVEAGDADGAEAALRHVLDSRVHLKRDFYQSSEPRYYLARAALLRQDRGRAVELLLEAEQESPGDPSTLALLHVLTGDEAESRKLVRYFGEIDARNFIGRAALSAGEPDLAVRNLEYVSRQLPDYRRGHVYLAAALGMAGRIAEGEAEYRTAMRAGSDPVMLERESLALFARAAAERPEDPFTLYSHGVVLRQFGHYREALDSQESARRPGGPDAVDAEITGLKKALAEAGR